MYANDTSVRGIFGTQIFYLSFFRMIFYHDAYIFAMFAIMFVTVVAMVADPKDKVTHGASYPGRRPPLLTDRLRPCAPGARDREEAEGIREGGPGEQRLTINIAMGVRPDDVSADPEQRTTRESAARPAQRAAAKLP